MAFFDLFLHDTLALTCVLNCLLLKRANYNYIYMKLIKTLQNCRSFCKYSATCAQVEQKYRHICTQLLSKIATLVCKYHSIFTKLPHFQCSTSKFWGSNFKIQKFFLVNGWLMTSSITVFNKVLIRQTVQKCRLQKKGPGDLNLKQ